MIRRNVNSPTTRFLSDSKQWNGHRGLPGSDNMLKDLSSCRYTEVSDDSLETRMIGKPFHFSRDLV